VNKVLLTLKLLNKLDAQTIVQEHPRKRLLPSDAADNLQNVSLVKDEYSSVDLIEWGDIFLSLGSSITFEPVMRKKPVLEISYAHANLSTVSHYFPNSDIRTFEQLYETLLRIQQNGYHDFYDQELHDNFKKDIITPNDSNVLEDWAEFIEDRCL
jgi:CDP-glycerol glycerophosphotransferase (TagB/SpsB family)